MTSVPNLQQRLNGSSPFLFFFVLLLSVSISSCDLFKKVPTEDKKDPKEEDLGEIRGGKVYDPTTGEYEVVENIPGSLDTVEFKKNPTDKFPPITSDGKPMVNTNDGQNSSGEGILKDQYNVTMMLPFVTNRFNYSDSEIYSRSEWALQYYGGAKIAFDKLQSEGVRLNVNMLDTEGSESTVRNQLANNADLQNADLIIGPYRSVNVRQAATFAKQNNKIIVSPYSAAARLSDDNPFLVQVNPSLEVHCEAITRHIMARHRADEVVLVVRDKPEEIARLKYFQDANRNISGDANAPRFKEFIVEESTGYADVGINEYVNQGRTTVFVIPSWANEVFVSSILRQINIAMKTYDRVIVYGMPQWMEYEKIDYAYFEKLNVHVSSSFFVDKYSQEARSFRERFFNRFGTLPNDEAYLGYDVTLYFGRMLQQHGTQFQDKMAAEITPMLHSEFDFQAVKEPSVVTDVSKIPTERYENMFVHILKFQEYYFQPAK